MIFKNGEELSDDELRQKLVSEIYEVSKSSIEVLSANSSVTVRYSDKECVIEAIPSEKDKANRLAPIIIYGQLPDHSFEIWIEDVCSEIENFVSSRLNRTLDGSALVAIQNWLNETLKKKTELQKTPLNRIKGFLIRLTGWFNAFLNKLIKSY